MARTLLNVVFLNLLDEWPCIFTDCGDEIAWPDDFHSAEHFCHERVEQAIVLSAPSAQGVLIEVFTVTFIYE